MERFFFGQNFNSVQYLDGKYDVLRIKQILIVSNKVDLIKAAVELNMFPLLFSQAALVKEQGLNYIII